MAQQKLYTKEMYLHAAERCEVSMIDAKHIMKYIDEYVIPIELPSDEEIDTIAKDRINLSNDCFGEYTFTSGKQDGFYEGAKWLRDKILNQ